MPELEARVQGDVAGSSWQDEADQDYEDDEEAVEAGEAADIGLRDWWSYKIHS